MTSIRNKIRTRGDQLYAEAIGRRTGRRCRRLIRRNFIAIVVVITTLCLIFLVPEFGVVKDKLVLFKDKLKAKFSGSTQYIQRGPPGGSSDYQPSAEGDP